MTPQQVLESARWILENTPEASEVSYALADEHWYVRMGDKADVSVGFKTAVVLRDVEGLARAVLPKTPVPRIYMDEQAHRFVTFTRKFLEHPKAVAWMTGAAWVVSQAADVKFVGANETCFRWHCRTSIGCCVISSTVEYRDVNHLRVYLDESRTSVAEASEIWVNREFLEDWFVCEKRVPVTKSPEVSVQVTASVTTDMSALPLDLQGLSGLIGHSLQERRMAHKHLILQDMMTRTAPPRYK